MISPEHVNDQKLEDKQVPIPNEGKEVVSAKKNMSPWIAFLLRGVAIAVSLIGGAAFYYLLVLGNLHSLEHPPAVLLSDLQIWVCLLIFPIGLVGGAMLFRSWWAVLFVTLAFCLGAYVVSYQIPKLIPLNDYDSEVVYAGAVMASWLIIPILAIIGACIGSYLGVLWKKGGNDHDYAAA